MPSEIIALPKLPRSRRDEFLLGAQRIFFATSNTKTFESPAARDSFLKRWFGRYAELQPEAFLFAMSGDRRVIGYVAGCLDTFAPEARTIADDIAYYTPGFINAMADYPSHFHINIQPEYQGQGIGHALVEDFLELCERAGSRGVHIVTGAASRAVQFYEACGFDRIAVPGVSSRHAVLIRALVPRQTAA